MSWLDRLLGRELLNPEEYERVRCELCDGKGIRMGARAPADHRERFHTCKECKGKGYVLKRKPEPPFA
jgi:DnaJ-class molecular chaperone